MDDYEFQLSKDGTVVAHGGISGDCAIRLLTTILNQKAMESGDVQYLDAPAKPTSERQVPKSTDRKDKKGVPNKSRYGGDDAKRNAGIAQALAKGEKPRHVAKQFGVSIQTVYNIKSRSKSEFATAQRATREAQREPDGRSPSKPLDGYEYDALRDAMHDRDFSSAEYALTNRLSPREVNAAIKSANYDDYLNSH